MKNFYRAAKVCLLLVLFSMNVKAQCVECTTCDYVIDASTPSWLTSDALKQAMGVSSLAGKTICFKAGTYSNKFSFVNLEGSSSAAVTIKNCGGVVNLNDGAVFYNPKYIKVLGNGCTGDSNQQYGFRMRSDNNILEFKDNDNQTEGSGRLTDIEVAFVDIGGDSGNIGSAGLKIIDQPGCDEDLLERGHPDRWIMRNIFIHDNYIHHVNTEGMYIGKGDLWYEGATLDCSGVSKTAYSVSLQHVRIYNNIVDDTGWDGIQLKDGDKDVYIHDNVVTNFGTAGNGYHNEGIIMGQGTVGQVYNNKIINGTGNGFQYFGLGNLNFYNNIISNTGENGMWLNGKSTEFSSSDSYLRILNNTIVKTGNLIGINEMYRAGIYITNYESVNQKVVANNIIAEVPEGIDFLRVNSNTVLTTNSNNVTKRNAQEVGFVKYAEASAQDFLSNDYHLTQVSPAVNAGMNAGIYTTAAYITKDYDGKNRGNEGAWDIGAYEYYGSTPPPSWMVLVNAGGDNYTSNNNTWERDLRSTPHATLDNSYNSYTTGGFYSFSGTNHTGAPNEVLGSYRHTIAGNNNTIKYSIPVPTAGADYLIELFFAPKNNDTFGAGMRKFNIFAEGAMIAKDYDVYLKAGTGAARFVNTVNVQDGILDISLVAAAGSEVQINAIRVQPANTAARTTSQDATTEQPLMTNQLKVFPNPVTNHVQIASPENDVYTLQILDLLGKAYGTQQFELKQGETKTIDVSQLPANTVYILKLNAASGKESIFRVIKE